MGMIPIVKVKDIGRALDFYTKVLGFEILWGYPNIQDRKNPSYFGLKFNDAEFHVSSFAGDGAFGTAIYVPVIDVDALYENLKKNGLKAADFGPVDQTWGQREIYITDPDNNCLRIGSRIKEIK